TALAFFSRWQSTDIAPIIVRPEQRNIIWHAQAFLIEVLHFFVQAPHLRDFREVSIDLLSKNPPLRFHDLFGQLLADRHSAVVFRAQAEGDDAFIAFVAPNSFTPELLEDGLLI